MKTKIIALLTIALLASCHDPKELTPPRYLKWIASSERGFIKTKKVSGVTITVRYLPSDYLAYRDFQLDRSLQFDSILSNYVCATVFTVTLQGDKSHPAYGNLMMFGVSSDEDFEKKTRYLSFNIDEFISMKSGGIVIDPILSNFEGYDQLRNQVSFQVSFVPPGFNCLNPDDTFSDIEITFEDPIWQLGVNHFLFPKQLLANSPRLKL